MIKIRNKGFTLIELSLFMGLFMVIIGILILTVLVIYWLTRPEQETLEHAVKTGRIKQG